MRGTNFISFLTVQGFFIGLAFSLLKADSPYAILFYTFIITGFFYLFSHLCVAFYFRTQSSKTQFPQKKKHENQLDLIIHEINRREQHMAHSVGTNSDSGAPH